MKKINLIIILILTLLITGIAKIKSSNSQWTTTSVIIDGKAANEWSDVKFFHEEKPAVAYAFKNDVNNLYIFFGFKDRVSMSTVMKLGMTIWIHDKKKKRRYGINFKNITIPMEKYIVMLERKYGPMTENRKEKMRKTRFVSLNINTIRGKKIKENTPAYGIKNLKPRFAIGWSQNKTPIFEIRIPLKREDGKIAGLGAKPGDSVVLGIEWGGWNKQMKKMARKRHREAMERWRANRQNSGKRREDDQAYEPDLRPIKAPKKYTIWHKVKLAKK